MIGSLITPTFPGGVQSTHTFYSSNLALSPAVQNNQTVSSATSAIYTAHHECSPPPSERPWSLPRDDPAERRVALPYIDCEFVRVPVNCMRCSGPVASSALSLSLSLSLPATLCARAAESEWTAVRSVLFPLCCAVPYLLLFRYVCLLLVKTIAPLGGSKRWPVTWANSSGSDEVTSVASKRVFLY